MFNVYQEPKVIEKFLTYEQCEYIISSSRKHLKPSLVNIGNIDKTVRKSECTYFYDTDIINHINNNCTKVLKKGRYMAEDLQIVYYDKGGFYLPHLDSIPSLHENKRLYTFIIALNDNYEGGETHFPNLKKSFKLRRGDALFFNNYNTNSSTTGLSLHGGKEVLKGEKWIANLWIRE